MATYLRFGTLTRTARKAVSVKRTDDAIDLIKKHGGEFKAGHALLGEVNFLVILDLPNAERAIQGIGGPEQAVGPQLPYRTRGQYRRVRQTRGNLGRRTE